MTLTVGTRLGPYEVLKVNGTLNPTEESLDERNLARPKGFEPPTLRSEV